MTLSRLQMEKILAQQSSTSAFKKRDNQFVDNKTAQDILATVARMKSKGNGHNTIRRVLRQENPPPSPTLYPELNYCIWQDIVHYFKHF